jgi:hypothetical protein
LENDWSHEWIKQKESWIAKNSPLLYCRSDTAQRLRPSQPESTDGQPAHSHTGAGSILGSGHFDRSINIYA